jgi:hypothetical protein
MERQRWTDTSRWLWRRPHFSKRARHALTFGALEVAAFCRHFTSLNFTHQESRTCHIIITQSHTTLTWLSILAML